MDGFGSVGTFVQNTIKSVSDRLSPMSSPFETIMAPMLPMAAFYASPILGIIFFVTEAFGYGPGWIGKMLDSAFGFKGGGVKPVIDVSSVSAVSEKVVETISKTVGMAKGSSLIITEADMQYVEGLCIVSSYHKGFIKNAWGRRDYARKFWRGMFGKGKYSYGKRGIVSALTGFIMQILKGVGIFGLLGGVAKTVNGKKESISMSDFVGGAAIPGMSSDPGSTKTEVEVENNVPKGWYYYKNIKNSVQDTLINYLNREIANFSNMFFKAKGKQLFGSPQMRDVLRLIEKHNYASMSQLDHEKGFVAPNITEIAQKLLPSFEFKKLQPYKPKTKPEEK